MDERVPLGSREGYAVRDDEVEGFSLRISRYRLTRIPRGTLAHAALRVVALAFGLRLSYPCESPDSQTYSISITFGNFVPEYIICALRHKKPANLSDSQA